MAALVKPAALEIPSCCNCEQMLRQQHAQTPMSGKSALLTLLHNAVNDHLAPFVSNETLGLDTTTASCATRLSWPETKCKSVC
jgi:hypothetical protein